MSNIAPGVFYKQRDLSQVVAGSSGTVCGIAGNAQWGPSDELTLIDNLDKFVQLFGKPIDVNATPMFYQALGWYSYGQGLWVVRPQGESKFGGAEALKGAVCIGIAASLDNQPTVPSGVNVAGIYTKYAGTHPEGSIYINIVNSDDTAGTFTIQAGVALLSGNTELDTGDAWYEEHNVSVIATAKADDGRSAFITEVLDRDSQLMYGTAVADAAVDDVPLDSTSLITLANAAYTAATDAEISLAYDEFASTDSVTIDLLIPGNATATVQNKVAAVSMLRGDCFYILSPAVGETWTIEGISGATGWIADITSRNAEGAAYANYLEVTDEYNDKKVSVPCAGWIAAVYANNDEVGYNWTAPAGKQRGVIQNADPQIAWLASEKNTLYSNKLNWIEKSTASGVTVGGQKTLYSLNSALNRVNVSRLILKVKRDLLAFLADYLYEYNIADNRTLITAQVRAYLNDVLAKQGLYDFRVVCDASNNTSTVIDNNELIVDIYLKPTKVAEFIYLRTTIAATGVDFETLLPNA